MDTRLNAQLIVVVLIVASALIFVARRAWRAIAAASTPIGPAPVMSTSSPTQSKRSAVWVALPSGSRIAATSSVTCDGTTNTFSAGITT
jgi:hypothetical protein